MVEPQRPESGPIAMKGNAPPTVTTVTLGAAAVRQNRPEVNPSNDIGESSSEQHGSEQRRHLRFLIAGTASRDRAAFRALYAASSRFLFGVIIAVLGSRGLAEEVAQEVYLTIWRRAGEFDADRGSPITWMAAIARNRAIDRLRAERARGLVSYDAEVPDFTDDVDVEQMSADSIAVRRALARLKPNLRSALVLTYFKGYSHSELACVLNVPVGTAKSWVRRGLEALREVVQ